MKLTRPMMTKGLSSLPLLTSDIEGLLVDLGVEISESKSNDEEVWGLCPGHEDRTGHKDHHPDWSINRRSQNHYCFSCGYLGSVQSLIMDVLGCGVFEANAVIREHGILLDLGDLAPRVEKPPTVLSESALAPFTSPPPDRLATRWLDEESAAYYGVLWDAEGRSNQRGDQGWILPVRSPEGDLWGWQVKTARGTFMSPHEPRKGHTMFGLDVFPPGATAIWLESPLDALRLRTAGIEGGVSSFGTGFTERQVKLVMEVASDIISAFDNDPPGVVATHRMQERYGRRFSLSHFNYGRNSAKDIGEMRDAPDIWWGLENARVEF